MIMGSIPDEGLRRVMMARSPQARACYVQALQADPDLRGKMTLTITVDGSAARAHSRAAARSRERSPEWVCTCMPSSTDPSDRVNAAAAPGSTLASVTDRSVLSAIAGLWARLRGRGADRKTEETA